MNIQEILAEREKTHGAYGVFCGVCQDLKTVMKLSPNWNGFNAVQKETMEMVAHKLSRALCGDPLYRDHYDDVIGYVTKLLQVMDGGRERPGIRVT